MPAPSLSPPRNNAFTPLCKKYCIFLPFFLPSQKTSLPLHCNCGSTSCIPCSTPDSVAQLVEQMTLNHWVESSSLSGVTKGSINPTKSSENHWFSELFLFTPIPDRRKILKLRVCKKGAVKLMLQTAPSIECISLFFNILQRYTFAIAAPSYGVVRVQWFAG